METVGVIWINREYFSVTDLGFGKFARSMMAERQSQKLSSPFLDVVGKAGAGFKSLGDTWADTTTPHGRRMLTVLGGLAELERDLIIARTGEGRTRAKARGVKFGRPAALTPHQRREAIQRLANGEAQADVARSFNVSQATISRLAAPSPFEASVVAA